MIWLANGRFAFTELTAYLLWLNLESVSMLTLPRQA
eukprot:COSAG06_NODE_2267_length_7205_cov_2.506192_5_plen_36_part_00